MSLCFTIVVQMAVGSGDKIIFLEIHNNLLGLVTTEMSVYFWIRKQ